MSGGRLEARGKGNVLRRRLDAALGEEAKRGEGERRRRKVQCQSEDRCSAATVLTLTLQQLSVILAPGSAGNPCPAAPVATAPLRVAEAE